jgi:hexosaminidase
MKKLLTPALCILFTFVIHAQTPLVPQPQSVRTDSGFFIIDHNLRIGYSSEPAPQLYQAFKRLRTGLNYRTGLWFEPELPIGVLPKKGINVIVERTADQILDEDESYVLTVDSTQIKIVTQTPLGLLRAVETFLQLVEFKDTAWVIPYVSITDKPLFAYRGLLIDVARRFMPLDVLKRNIDAMAAVKLNVLHLHLSDDQGWRLESNRFPSLHIMASDGLYYTQAQIKELVRYAEARGIEVIPEIDLPGHTTAILTAMPNLASKKAEYRLERSFGIKKAVLNPADDDTYTFISELFREMSTLFNSRYMHIGGDEVVFEHWSENRDIAAFMASKRLTDYEDLQRYFINRVADSLALINKSIIGWEEIFKPGLNREAVVQCWRNKQSAYTVAKAGYKTIVSQGYYLDLLYPLADYYNSDVIVRDAGLTKENATNVWGGEACLWSELIDQRTIDSRLWPTMAMIAERFWSEIKRDKRALPVAAEHINIQLIEHNLRHTDAPYSILHEIAGSNNIVPLTELREVVTPLSGYLRHTSGNAFIYTPLNTFADAASPDPQGLNAFYRALREFVISGANEKNFELIATKLYEWSMFYELNADYFSTNPRLNEIEPLAKNLSAAAKVAEEAMEYIVNGKIPKDAWMKNAQKVMEDAKTPVAGVRLSVIDELEKLIVFSKSHDVIVF